MMIRGMQRLLARTAPKSEEIDCRNVPGHLISFEVDSPDSPVITMGTEDYSRPKPYNVTNPNATDGWELSCRSLLVPLDMAAPIGPMVFIWGEPVLRKYYTIYDWVNKKVGFSTAGEATEALSEGAVDVPDGSSLAAGAPLRRKDPASDGTNSAAG